MRLNKFSLPCKAKSSSLKGHLKNSAAKTPKVRSSACLICTMSRRTLCVATQPYKYGRYSRGFEESTIRDLEFPRQSVSSAGPHWWSDGLYRFVTRKRLVTRPRQRLPPPRSISNPRLRRSTIAFGTISANWQNEVGEGVGAGVFQSFSGVKYNFEQVTIFLGAWSLV